ncbi:hypothetical protein [Paenibacillus bouchesdurhonensis]|nr:hypothetical protein [Paenibacillus bouchesdurhonensis]
MDISTDRYKIAPLNHEVEAIAIIQKAEAAIADATGNKITLIAFEESEE